MSEFTEYSDQFVDRYAEALPELATADGISDHDDSWRDWSLDGLGAQHELYRRARADASTMKPEGKWERLGHQVFLDEVDRELAWYESDEPLRDLNNVYSGLQQIRDAFDLMATETPADWASIESRMHGLDAALSGYAERLEAGRRQKATASVRQVLTSIDQARTHASAGSGLVEFSRLLSESGHSTAFGESMSSALESGRAAFGRFADYLENTYLPDASPTDAVGRERYAAGVTRWVGGVIEPEATYAWGWSEVRRLWDEMTAVAHEISPGASVPEALEILKNDPARAARSRDEFIEIMATRQAQALDDLDGTHFDVPEQIRTINVKYAPPGNSLGAYYTAPTEDFSRPGEVWYAVPADQTTFPLYDEVTTAYHEGFPGHHLQVGLVACLTDVLTRFHRKVVWMSGSGEGWALYAERIMHELGYLEKPDYVMGFLASQMLRSCRIAVDIGMHCDLPIPDDTAGLDLGDRWSFETATMLMRERAFLPPANAISEVTRYLGWPGQAIAYKVGEQAIVDLRSEAQRRDGAAFDRKAFHRTVLEAGAVGLGLLQRIVRDS